MKAFIPMMVVCVLAVDWLFLHGQVRASAWKEAQKQAYEINLTVKRLINKNI